MEPKGTLKRKLDPQVKSIIKTVYERCKKEHDNNCLMIPLEDYEERVSYYTACPKIYIYNLSGANSLEISWLDLKNRISLLRCRKDLLTKFQFPKFRDIYQELSQELQSLPPLHQFRCQLKLLGYEYNKVANHGSVVIEDPTISFERYNYISRIQTLRNESEIYYVDERLLDMSLKFPKPWVNKIDISSPTLDGLVLFHVITSKGYTAGLFSSQVTPADFNKWLIDVVTPFMSPGSIIVMDNSPLHSLKVNKSITKYHSKEEMLAWLTRNDIPCSANMHKAELYDLICRCSHKYENEYSIDCMLRAYGHDVLRLPTTFYDLSPTEILWQYIKKKINLPKSILDLKQKVSEIIQNISKIQWGEFTKNIMSYENDILSIDEALDAHYSKFKYDVHISTAVTGDVSDDSSGEEK